MTVRRGKLEIIVELLETCQSESHKTNLVYSTNLNFKIVNEYLNLLKQKGWIVESEGKYQIMDEGKRFLEKAKGVLSQL